MAAQSQASEALKQYLFKDPKGSRVLLVPEGKYKGWVPRSLYDMQLDEVYLPFLKLLSFPVGGTALGQLQGMVSFNVVGNYLFRLPRSFANCQNLVKLNLSFNYFEKIPAAVLQLQNLVELDCSENDIAEIDPEIGTLQNLKTLNLSGNLLDDMPEELANCQRLEHLDLSRKWYPKGGFKVLPESVCYLKELSHLDVSWHQIHTIPEQVSHMTKLQTLKMRGNFLRHVSENIGECKKLQYLDLTGAMKLNSYIPPEIFSLEDLRILDLTNNYFTEVSPDIVGLKKLKKFIMRRNALLRLPEEIFHLESIESLDVSENYLELVPWNVKDSKTLKILYLGCNKIERLPEEICECGNLVELQLHRNKLVELPENIYKLENLEELTLEENQLKTLPLLLDKLEKLQQTGRLSLYNNLLVKPPQGICNQGVVPLFSFMKELRVSEAKHRRKMILIGASKAGKTSLRNVLVLGKSKLTAENERTWVMERHLWEPTGDVRIQILDFGGHHIYSAAHHMFLTPEALHVLVFDLSTYSADRYDALIGDWIDAIVDRAPGATIAVVGTHADLCKPDEMNEKTADILKRMHEEEQDKVSGLKATLAKLEQQLQDANAGEAGQRFADLGVERTREKRDHIQRMLNTRVSLPDKIYIVSCAIDLFGIDKLRGKLLDTFKSSEERSLPDSWYKFLALLQDKKEKILNWSQALEIFESAVASLNQSMYKLQGSASESLDTVLRYLHVTGEIVWYHDNPKLREIVFHRPDILVEMLRVIFRHDFEEVVTFQQSSAIAAGISEKKFKEFKDHFIHHGLMSLELLHYLLIHFGLSSDARDMFADLMLKFDLCYEVDRAHFAVALIGSPRILQFPWFLSPNIPEDFGKLWPKRAPANTIELRFQLHFLKKSPPNFFEKMSARLQNYISYREDWKDGVLAKKNNSQVLFLRQKVENSSLVTLSTRGADLQELWGLILDCRGDMLKLLQEWPFMEPEMTSVCAHCLAVGDDDPYLINANALDLRGKKDLYKVKCPKQGPEDSMPACFVYPLDQDFQENLGQHVMAVKEFLEGIYDTTDSASILSDLGLSYVAANLGAEWTLVALNLNLRQATIEQIQLDNRGFTLRQILSALTKWRDGTQKSVEEKIRELIEAINIAKRQDLAEDLQAKYGITE